MAKIGPFQAGLRSGSRIRTRKYLGGVGFGVRFLTTLAVGGGFFVRLRFPSWIIFYITLLNWELLL